VTFTSRNDGGLRLAPISDAIADQERWITLIRALTHIQSVQNCDRLVAQVHLKRGIGQRVIPAKWADSSGPNDKPDVIKLRRSQLVLSGPGLAPSGSSLRSLLVLREAIHAVWPLTTGKGPAPPEADSSLRSHLAQWEAEEQYKQWMSLVEAIEHIRMSQHCNSVEALRQLKRETRDGMVRVHWEDSEGPKDRPDLQYLQASQLLLIGTGFASDNVQKIYRPLLIERSAVQELWRLPNCWRNGSGQTVSAPAGQQRQDTRPATEVQIREAAREVYQDAREAGKKPPNKPEAERLIRAKLPGATRPRIRSVLKQDEFDRQRWKRGHHRKP
jgi:hypothetical protein